MFWNLLIIENTKTLRRPMLWIELLFLALLIVALFAAMSATSVHNANENISIEEQEALRAGVAWPGGLLQALGMASGSGLGGLLIVILSGAITAQEYTWRTMQFWLSRGVSRSTLLAAKATAMLVPIAMIVATALLVGGTVSGVFTLLLDGSLHAEQVDPGALLLSLLRTAYSIFPYAGLAFLLGIATRSTAASIGGALTYLLLLENLLVQGLALLGGVAAKASACLPGSLASALLAQNKVTSNVAAAQAADPWLASAAALGIAAWTVAFIAAARLIFRRQDLNE
ncbi:MAG: ABC transporter permease subunit [Chloroflexota bacterium]